MEPAGRSEGIEIGRRQGRNSSGVLKTYVEQNHERGVCPTSRPPEEDDMEKWVRYCLIEGCYIVMVFCVYIIRWYSMELIHDIFFYSLTFKPWKKCVTNIIKVLGIIWKKCRTWAFKHSCKGSKHSFFDTVTVVLKHIWFHYPIILYFNDQDDDQSFKVVDADYVADFFFPVWLVLPRHDHVVVVC